MKIARVLIHNVIIVSVILTCFACTLKKGGSENANIHFTTIRTDSLLTNGLYVEFIYPDSACEASLELLQQIFVEEFFGKTYVGLSPTQALDTCEAEYSRFQNEQKNDTLITPTSDYYNCICNTIVLNKCGFISSVICSEGYFGGAHGWTETIAFTIDLTTNKLLTEKDFANENYEHNISKILVWKIMEKNAVTTMERLENLGYDVSAICPNGNFSINEDGLTYYFNRNEIAPYSIGEIEIPISFKELELYIQDDSPLANLIFK